jgi:citrate lyase subunit beta/citryl-CoA lyase
MNDSTADAPLLAVAGHRGDDVRSDCHVSVVDAARPPVVRSKVELMYGDSIRELVGAKLERFGALDLGLELDDRGALPFVIDARIETALRRAGRDAHGDPRPARIVELGAGSSRDRVRRSRLYLPGDEPKFMANAGLHGPDAVILDLEDSVHPDQKDAARLLVRNALRCVDFGAAERMVRINQGAMGLEDLDVIVGEGADLILVPKVEEAAELQAIDERINALNAAQESDRPLWLMPILESALGIENAFDIARASDRVVALTIGLEDYTADLGVVKTSTGEESLFARQRMVNAAKAAGVQAIDSVYGDVGDTEGLEAWCGRSMAMGFVGMGCVHPRQIEIIHRGFAPSAAELERARRIVEAFERAEREGRSVVSLGSKMIDPPVVKRALKLVALSDELNGPNGDGGGAR